MNFANYRIAILFGVIGPSQLTTGATAQPLDSGIRRGDVENRSYRSYATEVLDNLLLHGTDRYGNVHSDLLVSNLDVRTKANPQAHELAAADQSWRVERRERRAPGGSNFLHNQSVYGAMIRASQVTSDARYEQFVDSNLTWATNNLVDQNGMFWWGYHRHYDVHTETFAAEPGSPFHEMHFVDVPLWEQMWQINPTAVRNEIEAIWDRHVVDKSTGQINRHDSPGGLSFISSSASFIDAFSFLASKLTGTENRTWTMRAQLLANYNWNNRNLDTDLLAHTPNETTRWDGVRSATTTPALYVPALLRAYEHTGVEMFRDQAAAYLAGWAEHAYDPESGSFWGSLELDGTPVPGPWAPGGYEQFEPRGLIDLWAPEFITAQYNPDAAKAYAIAYQQLQDPELLATAKQWANLIRQNLPATETLADTWYGGYSLNWAPHGTYAEHYGHSIELFVALFEETSESHYLMSARDLANDAISSLWYEGMLRGHPNKPYYEAVDGVGVLLEALIDLDQHAAHFTKFGDFNGDNLVDDFDFSALTGHWLQSVAPYQDGDVTGDGYVSLLDFHRFKDSYYEGKATLAAIGVPEPATNILLASAALIIGSTFYLKRRGERTAALSKLH